uniref:Uncharacterized protein n=1 Tax=Gracilinema caldarium TaxID=215591 RepID=A0A7C3IHR4_9SPIR
MKLEREAVLDWLTEHRVAVLAGFSGAIILLVLLILALVLNNSGNKQNLDKVKALSDAYKAESIPRKELFMEEEPDFVPKVLYYRAPQSAWDAEFVSQFWQTLDDKTIQDLQKDADNRVRVLLEAIP